MTTAGCASGTVAGRRLAAGKLALAARLGGGETAVYSGDSKNLGASSACGRETVTVTKASPSLSTTPSPGGTAGTVILNDTATLSGGASPGGSITFSLYDPSHADCS